MKNTQTTTPLGNRSARMVYASRDDSSQIPRLFCAVLCQRLCMAQVARFALRSNAEGISHETAKSPRLLLRFGTSVFFSISGGVSPTSARCGVDHHSDSHSIVVNQSSSSRMPDKQTETQPLPQERSSRAVHDPFRG